MDKIQFLNFEWMNSENSTEDEDQDRVLYSFALFGNVPQNIIVQH